MLSELRNDFRYALRTLRKSPVFTVVAVTALAVGIGANTTVFSVVEAVIAFPLPLDDPERATFVYSVNPEQGVTRGGASADDFLDWREQSSSFEVLTAAAPRAYNLVGSSEPLRVQALEVTPGFFATLGKPPTIGRAFLSKDGQPGSPRVAILSHGFWRQQLDGRSEVLGETLRLDGEAYTVVGIAPEGFFFPTRDNALWTPLSLERGAIARDHRNLMALGRLRLGLSAEQATSELETLAGHISAEHPATNAGWEARVITIRDDFIGGAGFGMTLLYASITFVLLIACANVANLLLARATARDREIALRNALGAGRSRLVRQLLTESVVLALLGGSLGLLLGLGGMRFLSNMLAPDPNIGFIAAEMGLSTRILLHTAGVSLLAGLLFGLVPALQLSRPDLVETLKEGGRSGGGGPRRRLLRNGLVMAEVALALALLGTSGALIRAFNSIYTSDPGFNPKGLLTLQLALPQTEYPGPRQVAGFYRETLERLEAIPGVTAVTSATTLPLTQFPGTTTVRAIAEGAAEGAGEDVTDHSPNAIDIVVGPSYFETMQIGLVRGRTLDDRDRGDSLPVAVISETMQKRLWPNGDALGKRLRLDTLGITGRWTIVVGVVEDLQSTMHSLRFANPATPQVFLPFGQQPRRALSVVLRSATDPTALAPDVRRAVWAVDPNQPVDRVLTMEQVIQNIDTQNTFFVSVLSGLSLIALIMAAIGIYGVISYAVSQRVQEIGIRIALGAHSGSILVLVARQTLILTTVGLLVGVSLAAAFIRLVASQLEGIGLSSAGGPLTLLVVAGIFMAVAHLASYLPARRAMKVDPLTALRYE